MVSGEQAGEMLSFGALNLTTRFTAKTQLMLQL